MDEKVNNSQIPVPISADKEIIDYEFSVDINVINHLGVGLYSSTPAALAELVANSWDAEATSVAISISDDERSITIRDDGHGMSDMDVKEKFLKVGFSRRGSSSSDNKTKNNLRYVMGRKGIGKLAMLALSEKVIVSTQELGSSPISFEINVDEFKREIQEKQTSTLKGVEISTDYFLEGRGTEIKLINTHKSLITTSNYLRRRLARRFSVRTVAPDKFEIKVNNERVTLSDRDYYTSIKFLWAYDTETKEQIKNQTTLAIYSSAKQECFETLHASVEYEGNTYNLTGFIGSVDKPRNLGIGDEAANMISIFANGKVFSQDILKTELKTDKFYSSYLTGEIHADFLDRDKEDRATANREAIKQQDPLYRALITKLLKDMQIISEQWDSWRREAPLDENDPETKAINTWIGTLTDPRDKTLAHRVMKSVQLSTTKNDPKDERSMKRILYQNIIVGFTSLQFRQKLDKLEPITDIMSPEFQQLFLTLEQLEEQAYAQITRDRVAVIQKFKTIIHDKTKLEKVVQEYIFDNLWLIEPTWDRVSTLSKEMETTITKEVIDRSKIDGTNSRLDLQYKISSGDSVIIELKKPSRVLTSNEILEQARKYSEAFEEYYAQVLNLPCPSYKIHMLLGALPTTWTDREAKMLDACYGRIVTYENLLNNALNTYQQYMSAKENLLKGTEDILKMFKEE